MSDTSTKFVQTTVRPTDYHVKPPMHEGTPTVSKRIDFTGNFLINTFAPVVNRVVVQPTTGVIVWLPSRSVDSIYRYGIVPAGPDDDIATTGVRITYPNAGLLLPYKKSLDHTIQHTGVYHYSDANYPAVRIYAGCISLKADTTSIGNVALTGYLGAAALMDARVLFSGHETNFDATWQGANGTSTTFVADMNTACTQATTVKDCVKEVNATTGVCCILGPDIASRVDQAFDGEKDINYHGRIFPPRGLDHTTKGVPNIAVHRTGNTVFNMWEGWISPFNCTWTTPVPFGPYTTGAQQLFTWLPDIGAPMGGALHFKLNVKIGPGTATVAADACEDDWSVAVVDVFAQINGATGLVEYNRATHRYPVERAEAFFFSADTNYVIEHDASWHIAGFAQDGNVTQPIVPSPGIYLGSYVSIRLHVIGANAGAATNSFLRLGSFIQVRNSNDSDVGQYGPCRMMRWDGISTGQRVRFSGDIMIEYVPGIFSAGFTNGDAAPSHNRAENVNALQLASALYNDPSCPLRRAWQMDEYEQFCRLVVPKIDANWMLSLNSTPITRALYAAGYAYRSGVGDRVRVELEKEDDVLTRQNDERRSVALKRTASIRDFDDIGQTNTAELAVTAQKAPKVYSMPSGKLRGLDAAMERAFASRLPNPNGDVNEYGEKWG